MISLKGVVWAKMVKIVKFLFFAQKVSSCMGASHPKISRGLAALEPPPPKKKKWMEKGGGGQKGGFVFFRFQ